MIAAYMRESTDRQDIGTQRKLIKDHCDKRGVPYQEFMDDGVSGAIPFRERPQSGRLLELARQKQVQEVVVYLLRGLVRCTCGLCYYGMTSTRRPSGKKAIYYMHSRRSPRQRCTAAAVLGDHLEAWVWSDIEVFLSKPGAVIRDLEKQMEAQGSQGRKVADEIRELENRLASQVVRRKRAQDFLIDGTLDRADFDRQILRITNTVAEIEKDLAELRQLRSEQDANAVALGAARTLLEDLQEKTSGKLTFEQRRRAVEALVDSITVTPGEGQKQPSIRVRYAFQPHAERYGGQWERGAGLALDDMGVHRCRKSRRFGF